MPLVVATRNRGKLREFEALLLDALPPGTSFVSVDAWPSEVPEIEETGATFEENALLKAIQTCDATGATTLADDSGLVVDALGGRPGIFSARYAGDNATAAENNARLIEELRGVPEEQRSARYVAVVALCLAQDELGRALYPATLGAPGEGVWHEAGGHAVLWVRATCEGRIIDEARGTEGFGYDPHFLVEQWGRTMAEVDLSQKNERSHRAAAVRSLRKLIQPQTPT